MTEQFSPYLAARIEAFVEAAQTATRVVAFHHLPKTGGTSVGYLLDRSSDWRTARFGFVHGDPSRCHCGQPNCPDRMGNPKSIARLTEQADRPNLFFRFWHERHDDVRLVVDALRDRGAAVDLVVAVRPIRKRLVSMFLDYWTQVFTADRYLAGEIDLTPHKVRLVMGYRNDSVHYRSGRKIDGAAWFRAFAVHGAGVPFLLSEVYGGSVDSLDEALGSGYLRAVSSANLDDFLRELTGVETVQRRRVSVEPSSVLTEALAAAAPIIDEIAAREQPWDRVLARHLADPNFAA